MRKTCGSSLEITLEARVTRRPIESGFWLPNGVVQASRTGRVEVCAYSTSRSTRRCAASEPHPNDIAANEDRKLFFLFEWIRRVREFKYS